MVQMKVPKGDENCLSRITKNIFVSGSLANEGTL